MERLCFQVDHLCSNNTWNTRAIRNVGEGKVESTMKTGKFGMVESWKDGAQVEDTTVPHTEATPDTCTIQNFNKTF